MSPLSISTKSANTTRTTNTCARPTPTHGQATPYQDARGWTDKLNHAFVEGRRNIVFDTTLGGTDHWIGEMKKMLALPTHPYEVEVRVLATHRLEGEHGVHGVHERLTDGLDKDSDGRFISKNSAAASATTGPESSALTTRSERPFK